MYTDALAIAFRHPRETLSRPASRKHTKGIAPLTVFAGLFREPWPEDEVYASGLCVGRGWYFPETLFKKYHFRLTNKFDRAKSKALSSGTEVNIMLGLVSKREHSRNRPKQTGHIRNDRRTFYMSKVSES
jgi:hypothetical protein